MVDIGCGIGGTTAMLAEAVGFDGHVTAIDMLPEAITLLREEAGYRSNRTFVVGDAQNYTFDPGSFDLAYSRFGTMFFADPSAAFTNIRDWLRGDGRIGFVCWRGLAENELDAFPLRAAAHCLPEALVAHAAAATHFSFAQTSHLKCVLEQAGFGQIEIRPLDLAVSCGGLDDTVAVCSAVGSLGKILREHPMFTGAATAALTARLAARPDADAPRLVAAVWIVTAVASSPPL